MDRREKTGKILFETGFLIMAANVVIGIEVYRAIINHWQIALGGELFFQAFIRSAEPVVISHLNQKNLYIYVLSVLFSFLGNREELVLLFHLVLKLSGIGLFYLGIRKMGSFVYPFLFVFFSLVCSLCFYPIFEDTSMHLVWFLSGAVFWFSCELFYHFRQKRVFCLFSGIMIGFFCYLDFFALGLLLILCCFLLAEKKMAWKEKIFQEFLFLFTTFFSYTVTFCLWNGYSFKKSLWWQWAMNRAVCFSAPMDLKRYLSIAFLFLVSLIFKVLCDRRQEGKVLKNTEPVEEERSQNIEVTQTTEQPETSKVKLLENPLPLPKKHVKKELNYAFDPTAEQMHYDLNNYRLDDDYDLKEN